MSASIEQMPETERVIRHVRNALEHDSRLKLHRGQIAVTSEPDGTLVLEGETDSIAAKKIALEIAASAPGSTGIVDRLRVKPALPMGDGEIRDRVRDALIEEPAFARHAIYVAHNTSAPPLHPVAPCDYIEAEVNDGVVTLNGQVESLSHKRLAGVLVWWVPGIRDVVNGLDVQPSEEDTDDEISDAVRTALEKDRLIRSDSIRVTTRNAVVTLAGVAANDEQAAMAEADAWYVFGVNGVVNHLNRLD
jgi:osmotically-inducible protein OsmY